MDIPSKSPAQTWLNRVRICLKIAAVLAGLAAGYVWLVMLANINFLWDSVGSEKSLRLYSAGYALDSVCLILLGVGFFIRKRLLGVVVAGLAVAGLSFALRLWDYQDASGGMFWFEPYLRSGVFVFAFVLAYVAHRIPRGRRSSGISNLLDSTNEAEQAAASNRDKPSI